MRLSHSILLVLLSAQTVRSHTADINILCHPDPARKYLFYLHGAIVQEMGVNAVSAAFGKYEYLEILDTLKKYGYEVISEVRSRDTDIVAYAYKITREVETLLEAGVDPDNIIIVGASQGAYIAIEAAHLLKQVKVRYVIMALCNEYNINFFSKYKKDLCGNFLSIYERSDQKGSCEKLLAEHRCKSGYTEISLNMANGHGFIFKPYREWVMPLVKWINE